MLHTGTEGKYKYNEVFLFCVNIPPHRIHETSKESIFGTFFVKKISSTYIARAISFQRPAHCNYAIYLTISLQFPHLSGMGMG